MERAGIDPSEVSETILGQVLTAGQGQNPARQAHINAGLPIESAAWSINQVCGSGLRAVALAAQHIQLGDADIVAAGGQENMTLSPHVAHLRFHQGCMDQILQVPMLVPQAEHALSDHTDLIPKSLAQTDQ